TPVDVRVVAATNKDPEQAVSSGHMRQDLYFRLNVFHINLPPLREHKEDIPLLAEHILRDINIKHSKTVKGVGAEVMDIFMSHTWPGNIRELRNVLERSAIMCERDLITRACLPGEFGKTQAKSPSDLGAIKFPIGTTVDAMERELILQTLAATGNNKTRAAELLGISLKTLHNKLKEYGGDKAEGENTAKMQQRLRTKLRLVMTGLVFLVVVVLSAVFMARLTSQVIHETNTRANELAVQTFEQAKHSLEDAKEAGLRPASNSPEDRHEYVKQAFETNEGLLTALQNPLGSNAWIYEVSIVDRAGLILASSDPKLSGTIAPSRPPFAQLDRSNFLRQIKVLYGPQRVFESSFAFKMGGEPFGDVRVGISVPLLRDAFAPGLRTSATIALVALLVATGLAMVVTGATLAPLRDISAQLDRISAGQFDMPPAEPKSFTVFSGFGGFAGAGDELGLVSRKISQVGQQLRGVHEIFSTMRENLNSVMAGLEDGLLLFTRDARA